MDNVKAYLSRFPPKGTQVGISAHRGLGSRSAWASAVLSESLMGSLWVSKGPSRTRIKIGLGICSLIRVFVGLSMGIQGSIEDSGQDQPGYLQSNQSLCWALYGYPREVKTKNDQTVWMCRLI